MADPNDYYPISQTEIDDNGWPSVAVAPTRDLFDDFAGCYEGHEGCISFVVVRKGVSVTGTILEGITPYTDLLDLPARVEA